MIPGAGHLPSFFIPTQGHLDSLCVPTTGNLPILLKSAYARGLARWGEGWALLELTDA